MVACRLSYAVKEDKGSYYRAFDACNNPKNRGDLTPFVIMFLERINFAVEDLKDKLLDGYNKLEYFQELLENCKTLKQEHNNVLFVLIQDALFCTEGVTRRELSNNLDISYQTVTNELENLREIGITIEQRKVGRPIAYYIELDELEKYLLEEQKNTI